MGEAHVQVESSSAVEDGRGPCAGTKLLSCRRWARPRAGHRWEDVPHRLTTGGEGEEASQPGEGDGFAAGARRRAALQPDETARVVLPAAGTAGIGVAAERLCSRRCEAREGSGFAAGAREALQPGRERLCSLGGLSVGRQVRGRRSRSDIAVGSKLEAVRRG